MSELGYVYCILSFCKAQLSARMADGRVGLCVLSFCKARLSARMADGRVGLCILSLLHFCQACLNAGTAGGRVLEMLGLGSTVLITVGNVTIIMNGLIFCFNRKYGC